MKIRKREIGRVARQVTAGLVNAAMPDKLSGVSGSPNKLLHAREPMKDWWRRRSVCAQGHWHGPLYRICTGRCHR